jgi:beta-glucanase (GH16 family)
MRKIFVFSFLLISALAFCQKKELVWSDEFNYNGLPDSTKWSFEKGFVRNREPQYYTAGRLENTRVNDGNLIITAIKEDFSGAKYTSASIITRGKYEFTYGRVEVRAQLPKGTSVWPAIWTLGATKGVRWPLCGEIDILEYWGTHPDTICANVHTGDYNHTKGTGRGGKTIFKDPWKKFHIYALEWYPDRLDFYFDKKLYYSCKKKGEGVGEWPFDSPQYLLINLALTASKTGIDASTFPTEFKVDYVRIYKLK